MQTTIKEKHPKMLGFSNKGNNLKLIVLNFLLVFGVQVAFKLDDIINLGAYPSGFEFIKVLSNSLVITIVFYGYNKLSDKKKDPS